MSYSESRKKYAAVGVDTERAIAALKRIPISLNSWQLDDIGGWEHPTTTAPGNYPGRPRTPEEMFADLDLALRLIPGRHRINVHSLQNIQTSAKRVDRDQLTVKDFRPWIDFAKKHKVGFDFNPSCFMHPKADDGALSDVNAENRKFWIRHCVASLKIAEQVAKELKSPVSWTLWIAAGKHDDPSDRMGPRRRFKESLDEILRQTTVDRKLVKICLESQLWSPSMESYAVGSHEFMTNYAAKNNLLCLLDMAHFHPTENVADKISSMLLFSEMVAFHIARPVRFSCPHVSRFDDMLRDVAREIVANDPKKFLVALDFCDPTMNRVAGLVQGTRNVQLALLEALLLPRKELTRLQDARRFTEEFVLTESLKTYPLGDVYDEFCRREGVPVGADWFKTVQDYERDVQFKRGVSEMYYCTSYSLAVAFCVLTMFCWGSWGNAQKLANNWPYRHFYWDFVCGMLLFAVVFGLTLGSCGGEGAWHFLANLRQGSWGNIGSALLGGLIFNAALILLVKAIDMVGLAVAFPVCNGLSIALGTTVNYLVAPKGSPFWILGGIALITLAVLANAQAGRLKALQTSQTPQTSQTSQASIRGIAVAIVSGVFMSFFYSFVARTIDMDFSASAPKAGMLTPYAAFFLFVVGTFLSTFALNPVSPRKYFGGGRAHLAGFLGAAVWGVGTGISFVAAGPAGAAIAFGLGQGATLVSAIWGVFIWREFKGASRICTALNTAFGILFVAGLAALIKAGA